jgi:hypothetical protein
MEFDRPARGIGALLFVAIALLTSRASAYPEFQAFVKKNSGRSVNCALCHANADGPDGVKPGQIGRLAPDELKRLNTARAAFKPGADVDSPILNVFGNHVIKTLGKERFLQLRKDPRALADGLGSTSDLDGDGIPDAQEYLDGTDPLDAQNGNPWKLFVNNVIANRLHLLLLLLATASGIFAIRNLIRWFDREAHVALAAHEAKTSDGPESSEE